MCGGGGGDYIPGQVLAVAQLLSQSVLPGPVSHNLTNTVSIFAMVTTGMIESEE